jgi:hypothetical protein
LLHVDGRINGVSAVLLEALPLATFVGTLAGVPDAGFAILKVLIVPAAIEAILPISFAIIDAPALVAFAVEARGAHLIARRLGGGRCCLVGERLSLGGTEGGTASYKSRKSHHNEELPTETREQRIPLQTMAA